MSNNTPEKTHADEIIALAAATLKSRADTRDTGAERSMERAVRTFNALTGYDLSTLDGWTFMIVLKLARSQGGKRKHLDDFVDCVGYAALAGEEVTRAHIFESVEPFKG